MIRLRSQLITGRFREKCGQLLQTKPKVHEDITNHLTAQKTGTGYPDPLWFCLDLISPSSQNGGKWWRRPPCSPIHRLCACKTETIVSRLDFPWNTVYSTTNQLCQLSRLKAWVSRLQDENVILTRIHACRAIVHAVWPASNPIPVHMQTSTSATRPVSTNFAIFLPMCWMRCSLNQDFLLRKIWPGNFTWQNDPIPQWNCQLCSMHFTIPLGQADDMHNYSTAPLCNIRLTSYRGWECIEEKGAH